MSPNLRIALRFLTARKRSMLMSLSCIVLGIGLYVVTQATTTGFERFFIKTILGTNGAIRVEDKIQDTLRAMESGGGGSGSSFQIQQREGHKYVEGVEEPRLLAEALRQFRNVAGISEVLTGSAIVRSAFKSESVKLYGINLEHHFQVSDLANQLIQGTADNFRANTSGLLVGKVVAERLQLVVGDSVIVEAAGESRRLRVSAIFETGVSDIDKERVYLHLPEARSVLKKPTGASFLQLSLFDEHKAPADARHMEDVLRHSARSWQERERTWLEVFRALRISSGITVSVFTLIAGLAMFNTLAMIVMEKTKEIAILRSMGYTRDDVSRIFLWQAAIVLLSGSILGCALGGGVTYVIAQTPLRIRGIFAADHFIVAWSVWHYVAAIVIAAVVVMVASLIPARRAARLEPGDIIRGTSQ